MHKKQKITTSLTVNFNKSFNRDCCHKIIEEIYNTTENITLIIVTHRHKSVSNCDKIYLLYNGKIINEGKFAGLEKRHSF